jgi:hypothetical protein
MMKKISIFFLALLLFFSFTNPVSAACSGLSNRTNCSRGELRCNGNDGGVYCCSQAGGGCSQVPGGATQATSETFSANGQSSADVHGDCGEGGISTAIGCIGVLDSQTQFLGDILRWAVGIGGGIAFLLIVYAGFMIMTAAGNPERLKAGQELLTSAISGLILLILSVFVLRFIGIDILGLEAFGFSTN